MMATFASCSRERRGEGRGGLHTGGPLRIRFAQKYTLTWYAKHTLFTWHAVGGPRLMNIVSITLTG